MKPPPRSFAAPPPPPLDTAKAELRRALRVRRRTLHRADAGAGGRLAAAFQAAGLPVPAVTAGYVAMGSEIDPAPLLAWLGAQGARVVLPVVVRPGAPLAFREDVGGRAGRDALGLPVPPASAAELRPGLILVPLLGFDRRGGRVGQGGGYYDRTLEALRRHGAPVLAVGLAYAGQEVGRIPTGPDDQRLDGVLSETAYLPVP